MGILREVGSVGRRIFHKQQVRNHLLGKSQRSLCIISFICQSYQSYYIKLEDLPGCAVLREAWEVISNTKVIRLFDSAMNVPRNISERGTPKGWNVGVTISFSQEAASLLAL